MFIKSEDNEYINAMYIKNLIIKQYSSGYAIVNVEDKNHIYTLKSKIKTEQEAQDILNKLITRNLHDEIIIL